MDTKIALDMEIAVYRRLLESEETRLGLLVDGDVIGQVRSFYTRYTLAVSAVFISCFSRL